MIDEAKLAEIEERYTDWLCAGAVGDWSAIDPDETMSHCIARNDVPALIDSLREALRDLDGLHSWDGLMALLDEHYPEAVFPTREDDAARDPGGRIVSLIRLLDAERAGVAASPDDFPRCARCGERSVEDAGAHAANAGHWPMVQTPDDFYCDRGPCWLEKGHAGDCRPGPPPMGKGQS